MNGSRAKRRERTRLLRARRRARNAKVVDAYAPRKAGRWHGPAWLSESELAELERYRALWRKYSLSTRPAERERAERAFETLYLQAGLERPEVAWCGSLPALVEIVHREGWQAGSPVWHALSGAAFEPAWRALFAELEAGSVARAWESLRHVLWRHEWLSLERADSAEDVGEVRAGREPDGVIGLWTCVASGQWESRTGEFGVMTDWIGDLLPTFSFAREVLGLEGGTEVLPLIELARSAGPWFAHERRVFVSERPCELHLDEEERLHCPSGPALRYPDGYAIHAWHGVSVPAWAIEQPERITVRALTREPNVERRRALLEIAGYERLLTRGGFERLDHDRTNGATLWRKRLELDEDLLLLELRNATREPDGSHKRYVLRVPPRLRLAREALAWTFAIDEGEYVLTEQS